MAATTGPHPWAAATPSCPHAERPPRRRRVAPRSGVAVALGRVSRLARAGAAAHVAVAAERLLDFDLWRVGDDRQDGRGLRPGRRRRRRGRLGPRRRCARLGARLRLLVARLAHGAQVVHLAHRRFTPRAYGAPPTLRRGLAGGLWSRRARPTNGAAFRSEHRVCAVLFSRSQTSTVNDAARAGPVPPQ